MDLRFSFARPTDAAAVTALVRGAFRGQESRAGWTTEADLLDDGRITEANVLDKINDPKRVVLLAAPAGQNFIACCEVATKAPDLAYFGMFAVRPTLQAAGVGRRVLAEAERYARDELHVAVMEMTVIGQRDELIAWYLRRGYQLTNETRPFPYDELVDGQALRDDLYFVVLAKALY
jgi:GNAT superfamily N-acetyltransferase